MGARRAERPPEGQPGEYSGPSSPVSHGTASRTGRSDRVPRRMGSPARGGGLRLLDLPRNHPTDDPGRTPFKTPTTEPIEHPHANPHDASTPRVPRDRRAA